MSLAQMRAWDPGRPLHRLLFFRFIWFITWFLVTVIYRHRVLHAHRVPRRGGVLIVANHQSHLDPPTVGVSIRHRHIVPIARIGLFNNRVFGWFIGMLNSIPINEKEGDTSAIRKAVNELAAHRCILIFPEGSRTPDGAPQAFKRGAWVLLSRAKCTVVPAAVAGLYEAWPRWRKRPRVWGQRAGVAFGEPLDHDRLVAMGPDAGLAFLAARIDELHAEAARLIGAPAHRRGEEVKAPSGSGSPPPPPAGP